MREKCSGFVTVGAETGDSGATKTGSCESIMAYCV